MLVIISHRCTGSTRCNPFAEWDPVLLEPDFTFLMLSIGDLFLIKSEALLPRCLSPLLGVLHLFAHLGIVMDSGPVCDALSQVTFASCPLASTVSSLMSRPSQQSARIHSPSYYPWTSWWLPETVLVRLSNLIAYICYYHLNMMFQVRV